MLAVAVAGVQGQAGRLVGLSSPWLGAGDDGFRQIEYGAPFVLARQNVSSWFGEAMKWMRACAARSEPFFVYLPTNAPHGPLWVPDEWARPYQGKVEATVASFFGMIANIDENMGRLDEMLRETHLYENTILLFMTDIATIAS